jgi:shikimate kinase
MIGLPGAGKTTLARKLSRKYCLPVFRIGEYRSRFPSSPTGELDAWVKLFRDLSRRKWKNCILETTGLNQRESFIRAALPFGQVITVKLEAPKRVLYGRIENKRKQEQGGEWLFSASYPNKYEFVKRFYNEFKKLPAEIRIDTTRLSPEKVYKAAMNQLKQQMILYSKLEG